MTRSALITAVAAIGAAGLFMPLPVQAQPMFPAAPPACDTSLVYATDTFTLKQSNNIIVTLTVNKDGSFLGPASHTVAGKPDVTGGSVQGNINGGQPDFFIDWHNGVTNHYYGQIDADGIARGTTLNSNVHEDGWYSLDKFSCAPFEVPGVQGPENSDLAVGDPEQKSPPPPESKPLEGPAVSFETVVGDSLLT